MIREPLIFEMSDAGKRAFKLPQLDVPVREDAENELLLRSDIPNFPEISEIEIKAIAIGFCVFFCLLNLVGIKHVGRAQVVLVVILLIILGLYIVMGMPKPNAGQIDMHLKKSGINDYEIMRPADPKENGAEPAETAFALISHAGQRASWMALRPFTGRTHQLRAHMKAIGHPILGDPKYGDEKSTELSGPLKLQLHARRIELDHPSGGKLIVEAPISAELRAGFQHFGFDEGEADYDPFEGVKRQR